MISCDLWRLYIIILKSSKSFKIASSSHNFVLLEHCKEGRTSDQSQPGAGCCHHYYIFLAHSPFLMCLEVTMRKHETASGFCSPRTTMEVVGCMGIPHAYLGRRVRSIINEHLRCSKRMLSTFSAHMKGHWSECSLIFCFWLSQHFWRNKDDRKNNILMIKVSRFCLAGRVMARSKPWMPRDLYKEYSLSD